MKRKRKGKWERLLERYVRSIEFRRGTEIEIRISRTEFERRGLRWNRSGSHYVAYVKIPGTEIMPPCVVSFTGSRRSDAIKGLLLSLAGEERTCEEIEMELESRGF